FTVNTQLTYMNSHEIIKADLLDILFDKRNKQYGAYPLRKYYEGRLAKALLIALGSVTLLFLLIRPGASVAEKQSFVKDVIVQTFKYPEVKKLEPPRPPAVRTRNV